MHTPNSQSSIKNRLLSKDLPFIQHLSLHFIIIPNFASCSWIFRIFTRTVSRALLIALWLTCFKEVSLNIFCLFYLVLVLLGSSLNIA